MTNEEAQKLAPSYLRLPDDGAEFTCHDCGKVKHHSQMVKPFTPDGVVHFATCLDCMDEWWMQHAKDCGVAE